MIEEITALLPLLEKMGSGTYDLLILYMAIKFFGPLIVVGMLVSMVVFVVKYMIEHSKFESSTYQDYKAAISFIADVHGVVYPGQSYYDLPSSRKELLIKINKLKEEK